MENKQPGHEWDGTIPLTDEQSFLTDGVGFKEDTVLLTDASPTRTYTIGTGAINDLVGFIRADKGCTLIVYPLPVLDSDVRGKASTTLTIADGGVSVYEPWRYSEIGSPRADVVVTKTEAGDMTVYGFTARGR